MRVLLVNPRPTVWNPPRVPPLGIGYLASALEAAGHRVGIWDAVVDRRTPDLADWQVVGATAVTPQVREAWRVLERAKAAGAITVIGGPHPTCLPDESITHPFVDYVVRKEGEETLPALLRRVDHRETPEGVAGVTWKRPDGRIVHEPDAPPIDALDAIRFPAYHLLPPLDRYTNAQPLLSRRAPCLPILTSRGCPYGCAFCYKGTFGRSFRSRSPESVATEWEWLVREHKAREIAVQDDVFNLDIPRATAICREIVRRGVVVPWSTPNGLRADRVTPELLDAMRESGCERVAFGVETGDQGLLDALGKNETLDQIREAFSLARRARLRTMAFFVIGQEGETEATIESSIRFAIELKPTWAQFTMATPYPGTRFRDDAMRDGRLLIEDWDAYGHYTSTPFVRPRELAPEAVERGMRRAYRRFYLRVPFLASFALRAGSWRNLGAAIRGAWHLMGRA
ncbi:MAG: radical SAM protein [Candidatus Coatesbacteria bacterium]